LFPTICEALHATRVSTSALDVATTNVCEGGSRRNRVSCVLKNTGPPCRYRDNYEGLEKDEQLKQKQWFKHHLCSFMFVGDDFMPNPDFKFPPTRS
jgi:hypothetical protein